MRKRATRRPAIALAVIALVGSHLASGCTRPDADPPEAAPAPESSSRCRVMGQESTPHGELDRLRDSCERAVPVVAQLWPGWTGSALVLVSATDLDPGTAAHVEGLARDGEPAGDDRVVVAPGLTDQLSPEGLDVVLRHELTHVAMRSTRTAPLPVWSSEGLAEHVGYLAVTDGRRDRRPELERLRGLVESGVWTATVPGAAAFDDPEDRSEAYTAAWLGVEVLLEHLGPDRVVMAMRRQARTSEAVRMAPLTDEERTRELLVSLGVSEQWLEERWRLELVRRTS